MDIKIEESWKQALSKDFQSPTFLSLNHFVQDQYKTTVVFPPEDLVFRAFDLCPFDQVKVVILGQDPYHGQGQANGLCFSVSPEVPLPPSLVNIFKEIQTDLGRPPQTDRTLESWARQGVLLINATLTVRSAEPTSHAGQGWEWFTDRVLKLLSDNKSHLAFILWGSYAQKKGAFLDPSRHLILKSPHPSPLSSYRGFFGSKPFSKVNQYLESWGLQTIDW